MPGRGPAAFTMTRADWSTGADWSTRAMLRPSGDQASPSSAMGCAVKLSVTRPVFASISSVPRSLVASALEDLDINPEKPNPATS